MDVVVAHFLNPDNLVHWQDGFISKKELSGDSMQAGAVAEFRYLMGKNELTLYETVIRNDLPHSFLAEYECDPTLNTMLTSFYAIDKNTTEISSEVEYLRFTGMILAIMKTIFPWVFKKQVQKWLNNFKRFVESQDY